MTSETLPYHLEIARLERAVRDQRRKLAEARRRLSLLESTASELLLALSDRGIDLPEMEALARVMEER